MPSSKARRSIGLFSPNHDRVEDANTGESGSNHALSNVPLNDDDAERLQRKQDKVLELHLQSSPGRPNRRRSSLPPNTRNNNISGMTTVQLAEVYSSCIKLSTENKITIKNAFGLHLIDYMALMLKKNDPEMNNIPVASLTLDASAKIYGYRVDGVHVDTSKIIGGLSRTSKKHKETEVEDDDADLGTKNTRKKRVKSRTIEQNIKALNVNKVDLQFEVDPLFDKTTEMFEEMASSGGYVLSILRSKDDSIELLLDPSTVLNSTLNTENLKNSWVDINELQSLFDEDNFKSRKICPAFSDFEFGRCNLEDYQSKYSMTMAPDPSVHDQSEAANLCDDDANLSGGSLDCDIDNNVSNDAAHSVVGNPEIHVESPSFNIGEMFNKSCHPLNLVNALASEPNEYSYFDERLLSAWAGPHHWRPFPVLRDKVSEEGGTQSKTRVKKVAFRINYSDEVNFKKQFKPSKSESYLSKSTIKQWSVDGTTLPEDLHYNAHRLVQLFLKPTSLVHSKKLSTNNENHDESLTDYDYNNQNDVDNFVPVAPDADALLSPSALHSPTGWGGTNPMDSQAIQSPQVMCPLTGDNLVPEPRKVSKFEIPYSLTAKKIPVKYLKTSIWKMLTIPDKPTEPTNSNLNDNNKDDNMKSMIVGEKSFTDLYQHLHESLPKKIASDLSQHIAFICILHLANEKNLHLIGQKDMQGFKICQGRPH